MKDRVLIRFVFLILLLAAAVPDILAVPPSKPGDPLFCAPNEGAVALILNGNVGIFTVNNDCYGGNNVTTAADQIITQATHGTLTNTGVVGGNAQYSYTLVDPTFTGTDTFVIHLTTSRNGSAGGPGDFSNGAGDVTMTLNVLPATASVSVPFNTTVSIPVPAGSISGCPANPVNHGAGPPAGTIYGCVTGAASGSVAPQHGSLHFTAGSLTFTYTPTVGFAGTDTFTYNAQGIDDDGKQSLSSGDITVQVTVLPPPPPVISSGATASGDAFQTFRYAITASNSPTSFSVTGTLPAGVILNASTGVIGGTPTDAGTFHVTIGATNAGGTGTAPLTITIAPPPPLVMTVTSNVNPATIGQPVTFRASISGGIGTPAGTVQFLDDSTLLGSATISSGQATFITSVLILGAHRIVASYVGTGTVSLAIATMGEYVERIISTLKLTASPVSIAYGDTVTLTAQLTSTPPAGVAAPTGQVSFQDGGSSLGTATLDSGTATVITNALTVGTHLITATYSSDSVWGPSQASATVTVALPTLQITSATGAASTNLSPDEIVSIFHVSGLSGDTLGTLPYLTTLAGVTVTVTDSAGTARAGLIYGAFASASQVNFVVPSDTALGAAMLTITVPQGPSLSAQVNITSLAPGVFTANANGQGVFAGQIVHVHPDNSQTTDNSSTMSSTNTTFAANPIDLGPATDQVFLVMYGTGIRHAATVTASINGTSLPAVFAPQGTYPGLDQVNVQLLHSLAGAGTVDIVISADGQPANTVTVTIQ